MTWRELVQRITLRFPFPISVRAELATEVDGERLLVDMGPMPCVNSGEPVHVYTADFPPPVDVIGEAAAMDLVRRLVKRALEHELDESLLLDGRMVRNPHERDLP